MVIQLLLHIYVFVLGCLVGSFLNVCIYRLPRGKSVFRPMRSYCPQCHEPIAWYDNMPVVSYLRLGGCCRHCGGVISPRYALVELLTGGLFLLTFVALRGRSPSEPWGVIAISVAFVSLLIASSFIDLELRIIPDSLTLGGAACALVLSALLPQLHDRQDYGRDLLFFENDRTLGALAACIAGMAVGAFAIWITGLAGRALFRKEAMGLGDVKFMAMVGGFLGWKLTLVAFFIAPLFGALIGIAMLIRTRDHHIPYGPFLSIGAFIAMLWGMDIVHFFSGM